MIKFSKSSSRYGFMSNFYECSIEFDGITYLSTEAAWQAQKTLDLSIRRKFSDISPRKAKSLGRNVDLRADWEEVKYDLMVAVLKAKFTQHGDLGAKLLSTGDEELMENTTGWHDNIWGNCDCERCKNIQGQNLLGKALMEVRKSLKGDID